MAYRTQCADSRHHAGLIEVNLSLQGYGQRIRQARLDLAAKRGKPLSQVEVAKAVGVSSVTVGYWEAEKTEPDGIATWRKLARVLNVSAGWLAFGEQVQVGWQEPAVPHTPSVTRKSATRRAL